VFLALTDPESPDYSNRAAQLWFTTGEYLMAMLRRLNAGLRRSMTTIALTAFFVCAITAVAFAEPPNPCLARNVASVTAAR
jgi:hypothetical protein